MVAGLSLVGVTARDGRSVGAECRKGFTNKTGTTHRRTVGDMSDITLHQIESLIAGQGRESKAHWEGLRREINARFDAVDDRLAAIDEKQRIANGRVTTMERAMTLCNERIAQLQKADDDHDTRLVDLARRMHRRATDKPTAPPRLHSRSDDGKPITRRDVYVGTACGLASAGLVIWILEVIGKL